VIARRSSITTTKCCNLNNQIGTHRVINYQSGGAKVRFYTGYNCTDSYTSIGYVWEDMNLTPINSIELVP